MARGERGRLVEEEQFGVVAAPDFALAVLELADADDPLPVGPMAAPQRLVVAMELAATVAHHRAARGNRAQFAKGIDSVGQRARGAHCEGVMPTGPGGVPVSTLATAAVSTP